MVEEQSKHAVGPYGVMRFTEGELALLKETFRNNEKLVKLMRKVFAPHYDFEAPYGQTSDIMWIGMDQLGMMPPQDREIVILSQIKLNNHLEKCLIALDTLANATEETPEQREARTKKDSTK